jgi:hypothetical protein
MKVAIYNNPNLKVLVSAMPDIDIQTIAEKDVPSGIPFLLVNQTDLPTNVPQETWQCEINESNCDGIGLTKKEFDTKYPECKGMAIQ